MSFAQPACLSMGSTERPMILTPRLSNSGLILAIYPSSVVQTGVKSLGCENSTAHLSPIQSWKRILPSVVSASKSGAVSLIARVITHLRRVGSHWSLEAGNIYSRSPTRGPVRAIIAVGYERSLSLQGRQQENKVAAGLDRKGKVLSPYRRSCSGGLSRTPRGETAIQPTGLAGATRSRQIASRYAAVHQGGGRAAA